jgi:hypothetical protein
MMRRQSKVQNKLFYTAINLEQRVRKNHILIKVKRNIDFDFIYNEVRDKYGINGNESVAPPIILKMMLLLIFYNVRSEREEKGTSVIYLHIKTDVVLILYVTKSPHRRAWRTATDHHKRFGTNPFCVRKKYI